MRPVPLPADRPFPEVLDLVEGWVVGASAADPADSADSRLSATARAVLAVIRKQAGKGLSGKEIVNALRGKGIGVEVATFRRHVVKELKAAGIKNHRSRGGYYYDPAG